jgi:hypothetical protein
MRATIRGIVISGAKSRPETDAASLDNGSFGQN